MRGRRSYEVAVVGGGPAGTTTALYTTRLGHRTAVFETTGGRHAAVSHVHNVPGISEEVSGSELAGHVVEQLREYGADYYPDEVQSIEAVGGAGDDEAGGPGGTRDPGESGGDRDGDASFVLEAERATVEADRVVLATGFSDVEPSVPGLQRFAGRGLFYCLHCDAYSLGDAPAFVLGHDEHAAEVAMLLLNFTADVDLLLDGREPTWDAATDRQLDAHPVGRIDDEVVHAYARDDSAAEPWLGGLTFADGTDRAYRGGFAMYGTEYDATLAAELGCRRTDAGAVAADDRGETSVDGVYAVGDVTHGQNQTTIAMGDGARAGIALHTDLRRFPRPVEEVDESGDDLAADAPAVPADLRARMRQVRERDSHAGLSEPAPDR